MEMTSKNRSIRHFVCFQCVYLVIWYTVINLLSSCVEETVGGSQKPGSGEKVAIQISLGNVTYKGNEVVTHHGDSPNPSEETDSPFREEKEDIEETVVVPLSDDIYMYATLGVEQDVKMRAATSDLDPGSMIRVVAYLNGASYFSHADYTVSNANELIGDLLQVDAGYYKFVAYSYNTTTLPSHHFINDTIAMITPDTDLLWGCFPLTGTYQVTATAFEEITITMSHIFSKVMIQATTSDIVGNIPIVSIGDVSLSPGKNVSLIVKDTIFTAINDAAQFFSTTWSGSYSTTLESQPRLVNTNGSPYTEVSMSSVTLQGYPTFTNNLTAHFDKQLERGVSYTLKVHFKKLGGIVDDARPDNLLLYVGAFWKATQTGERLIRIQRPAISPVNIADGDWTATVISGTDWIVLDTEMTTDPNVGWRSGAVEANVRNGNEHNFDIDFPVNSALTTVKGNMNASVPQIYFRIGLKSAYSPSPNFPARYGIVLLTYKGNTLNHRIWIRQGEGDDFVMTNADPVSSGGLSSRTVTRRFSPYNLTANALNAIVNRQSNPLGANPSKFTDYPTQAGAFFQWGNSSYQYVRLAWSPHTYQHELPILYWPATMPVGYWSALSDSLETCLPGYRRPTDGSTSSAEFANSITYSELRQSLFLNPQTGFNYNNDISNSSWGYYADGFFDRRLIGSSNSTTSHAHSTVSGAYSNVAYIGRLFFNPYLDSNHYGASLFFPAAGWRYSTSGNLTSAGLHGVYWSSSAEDDSSSPTGNIGANLSVTNEADLMLAGTVWRSLKSTGMSIRCVRSD